MNITTSHFVEINDPKIVPVTNPIVKRMGPATNLVYPPSDPSAYFYTPDTLSLSVDVFTPTNQLTVIQNFYLNNFGRFNLQFFIQGCWSPETPLNEFQLYRVSFSADANALPDYITLAEINQVEFFLWNEDPKTSRGTVTTVIPATH